MVVRRSRAVWAALTAVFLVAGGAVAPAMADDPPPVWVAMPGTANEIDGLSVGLESTTRAHNPWGIGSPDAPPVPYIRPVAVNNSGQTRYLGFGMDIAEEDVVEHLWNLDVWGGILGDDPGVDHVENFLVALEDGQSLADVSVLLSDGVPSGRVARSSSMSSAGRSNPTPRSRSSRASPNRIDSWRRIWIRRALKTCR